MGKHIVIFGFLGLGDLGMPMAQRLLGSGHDIVVWNRSPAKAEKIVANGARLATCPADVMDKAELIGLCLTSHLTVEEVAFGPDGLFASRATSGKAIADFSTGDAAAAADFAKRAADRGAGWVDAPVSGGVAGAINGSLIILAGGESETIDMLSPLFAPVSARVTRMGPAGSGQIAKICNQMIVAANLAVLAETLSLARKAGIDLGQFAPALKGGFADSTSLQIFAPRMAEHRLDPRVASMALFAKDIDLARQLASRWNAATPMIDRAAELFEQARGAAAIDFDGDVTGLIALHEEARAW